jgi:hypothetical protein
LGVMTSESMTSNGHVVTVDVILFCFVRVMESGLWEW